MKEKCITVMYKLLTILIVLFITQLSYGLSFKELQEIPHDSANAQNMKIWFPVKSAICHVNIRIVDSKLKHIRNLVKKRIAGNFYNIYWDKKDDSGNFVPEGTYRSAIISCDYKRLEPLHVKYAIGEKAVQILVGESRQKPVLDLTLLEDSLKVSLEIINSRYITTEFIFSDSLITGEKFIFGWHPDTKTPSGNYFYKLKINDFEHLIPFKYKK